MSVNIIFWSEDTEENKKEIIKKINSAYKVVFSFFNQKIPEIDINVVNDREQFDLLSKKKTSKWEVGYTFLKDNRVNVVVFTPESFEKYTNHKNEEFAAILVHELVHVFSGYVLKFFYPKWLHEGLAGYVAGQYKNKSIKKVFNLNHLHKKQDWDKNPNYSEAYLFTKFLFDQFGKEKMMEFMASLGWKLKYNDFKSKFKNQFKENIEKIFMKWKR